MSDSRIAPGANQPQKNDDNNTSHKLDNTTANAHKKKIRIVALIIAIASVIMIACSLWVWSATSAGENTPFAGNAQQIDTNAQSPASDTAQDNSSQSDEDGDNSGSDAHADDASEKKTEDSEGAHDRSDEQDSASLTDADGGAQEDNGQISSDLSQDAAQISDTNDGASDQNNQSDTIHISVSIDSSAADNSVSCTTDVELPAQATALDALIAAADANGIALSTQQTAYGTYISAIGNLAEKQFGGASGWLYAVNGGEPGTSASSYVLHDGDSVSWFYTR